MNTRSLQIQTEKHLLRRYLIWCYKTTKEDLDRIDRYFTQLKVDERLLSILKKEAGHDPVRLKKCEEFKLYMDNKVKNVLPKKFSDVPQQILQPEYWYLQTRLKALEQTIKDVLGPQELKKIVALYEAEMTRRILEAREHT